MKTLVYGYQFVSRVFEKTSAENGAKKTSLEITLSIVLKSLTLLIKTASFPNILISFLNSRDHAA